MKLKWDVDGKGVAPAQGGLGYSGPDLVKGSYVCKVKRMTVGKINKQGENYGKPRITVLLEVCGPEDASEYFGHPIWEGLNIIESGRPYVNAFLHALTDGSPAEKKAIEAAFWPPNGPNARKETTKDGSRTDLHIKKIGKYNIGSPNGELLIQVVAKPDSDQQGNFRARVDQYLPYTGPRPESDADVDDDEDDDYIDDADDDDDDYDDDDVDDEDLVSASVDDEPPF